MKCCVAKSCCSNWRVSGWASPPNQSLTRDMRLHGRSSYKHTMLWTHAHCSERNKPSSIWFRTQWFEILKFIYEKHIWNYFYRWKKVKLCSAFKLQNQIKEIVQFDICLTVHHQLGKVIKKNQLDALCATLPLADSLPTTTTGYHML